MIIRTRGQDVELRAFALTDMTRWGYTGLRNISTGVSEGEARGVPALHRAARIRAESLASLRLRCWRGQPPMRERVDTVWQAKLFERQANPFQTRFGFWETIGESLAWRNNAYIWKNVDPATFEVIEWWALHPDQIACKGPGQYEVEVRDGYMDPVGRGPGRYRVDTSTILHIRGHGNGGAYEAPSPIQIFRDALRSPVERQRQEANHWRKGTALRLAVRFPVGVSKDQADEFRDTWRETYEGGDSETTAILGGGAEIQPISMSAKDAEFVAMAHLTVEDAGRIMGVPSELLELRIGEQPAGMEEIVTRLYRFGTNPELERIESALAGDFELFGLARTTPGFESEGTIRADLLTEDTIWHQRIQDGRALPDEWRNEKGMPPLPNGMGKIPQIVPVGGGPNPNGSVNGSQATSAA